ncbi:uncharacterized protein LOC131886242 [Tigriopus californicus]|uniref:uncharacterized protein LOC131886242 n=1 Tax=Tigriopus californicus TaxID=6832 RepID=UPI0027DA6434|nr:uncharacterized protein LOC131886242 [Tigriopus californicus]|eukprot:TCALIF_09295-PA protein Name:"Protein of unknown function" AED:0.00 eAED:0.00 QI:317/1/1/1/1/1/2/34/201
MELEPYAMAEFVIHVLQHKTNETQDKSKRFYLRRVRHLLTCGECPSGDEMDVALRQAGGVVNDIPLGPPFNVARCSDTTNNIPGTSSQSSTKSSATAPPVSYPNSPSLIKIKLGKLASPPYKKNSAVLKSKWRRQDRKRLETLQTQGPKSQKQKLLGLFYGHRLVGKGQKPRRIPIKDGPANDLVSDPRISMESEESSTLN